MSTLRIGVMSAITAERCRDLARSLARAVEDQRVSVVTLHGREGTFCTGLDLAAPELQDGSAGRGRACAGALARLVRTLAMLPRPVIAEVDGAARGGGVGLAAACDVVVATRGSTFGLPEVALGMVPAVITPVLLRRLSAQRLRWVAMSGRVLSADEAWRLGLVDFVVEAHELPETVARLSRELARACPQIVGRLKEFVEECRALPLKEALAAGARITGAALESESGRAARRVQVRATARGRARRGAGEPRACRED